MITRRRLLGGAAGAAALPLLPRVPLAAAPAVIRKAIPSTGERLPVIGMGSSQTFDVGDDPASRAPLARVLVEFFAAGGTVIDSSPMYGNAETVIGDLLAATPRREPMFAATKVWTDGREAGIRQMEESMRRMRVARFDLMQIHNLRDWRIHLPTLREWKAKGRVRYVGITTSHGFNHDALEAILEREPFDFVQFSYSLGNRTVERRLLPIARERGIAVLVNRPFQRGRLFGLVRGRPVPDWAREIGCASWAQLFLKYAVSHPDVTCAIPATANPAHMLDNMGANVGALPDAALRRRMEALLASA